MKRWGRKGKIEGGKEVGKEMGIMGERETRMGKGRRGKEEREEQRGKDDGLCQNTLVKIMQSQSWCYRSITPVLKKIKQENKTSSRYD